MNLTEDKERAIDRILIVYNVTNEVPPLEKIANDIKKTIDIEFHESVIKRLLTSYKVEKLLPIVAKILDKNH